MPRTNRCQKTEPRCREKRRDRRSERGKVLDSGGKRRQRWLGVIGRARRKSLTSSPTTWAMRMPSLSEWKPDDLLKALVFLGAAIAFIVGLAQYRRAQHWKRAEWVAQEMKSFLGDPVVQAVLLMLDWGSRRIPLYPHREEETDRYVLLTNEVVADALMVHDDRPNGFSDLEGDIRAAFDRALDGLERFHSYVDTGLVELSDLRPYLKYWAVQVCRPRAPRPNEHRFARLTAYMDRYGYEGAHDLLKRIAAAEHSSTDPGPSRPLHN
jgi:hypothetical protein